MEVTPEASPLKPAIQVLPQTTVRQIGSSQVLVDPSSAVKELIDNALDARATIICVEIASNTIDVIQLRDNGHGIALEDRALVCRRYCTSKIRAFDDLKDIGGKWLGFRGEAMASMAEISGSLTVTTRVEGEIVATLVRYDRNGEMEETRKASHPIGTTVRVTDFFKSLPVRRQAALKHSAKWLAKIKRLMQAYALARPVVRFSLRILQTKSAKGNWVYAPKAGANVEDAAFKVVGRECASQCEWTAMESDGFEIQSLLPKPNADGAKVDHEGPFISIDSRPVSATRGTFKQVYDSFKKRLRNANSSHSGMKYPFMCMNIICPPDTYDPNIEPAKDDVLFDDARLFLTVVDKLLKSYYPEVTIEKLTQSLSLPVEEKDAKHLSGGLQSTFIIYQDRRENDISSSKEQPHAWRGNMYETDEENLEMFLENEPPVEEVEEENPRVAAISNPWTIAKMNAPAKNTKPVNNGQLMTPLKEKEANRLDVTPLLRSQHSPAQSTDMPLTPHTSSHSSPPQLVEDEGSLHNIQRLHNSRDHSSQHNNVSDHEVALLNARQEFNEQRFEAGSSSNLSTGSHLPPFPEIPARPRKSPRKQRHRNNALSSSPSQVASDNWFRNTRSLRRYEARPPKKPTKDMAFSYPDDHRKGVTNVDRDICQPLFSENNRDIRDFIPTRCTQRREQPCIELAPAPSFTPINPTSSSYLNPLRASDKPTVTSPRMESTESGILRRPELPKNINAGNPGEEVNPMPQVSELAEGTSNSSLHKLFKPLRRKSTSHLQRTKSSKLPLERVPRDYHIQDMAITVNTYISDISQISVKLDMRRNSPEWGLPPHDAYDAFAITPTSGRLRAWCHEVEWCLSKLYEREEGTITSELEKMLSKSFEVMETE